MNDTFPARLAAAAAVTDRFLTRLLDAAAAPGGLARPDRLIAAMRYAVLGPGKRLRPFLVIESARLFGAEGEAVTGAAAALECVHSYSLVHDDLPAMDDDDLRRGRPTVHRAFDEGTAVLAGDALLTLAFEILAGLDASAEARSQLVGRLAEAAGWAGMVGGQMLDMTAVPGRDDPEAVLAMQGLKTGRLFRYACEAGAILGDAPTEDWLRLVRFGEKLGQAFQFADDLLDATGKPEAVGKATRKDAGRGKATLVGIYGIDESRQRLEAMVGEAEDLLRPFGSPAETLVSAARFAGNRSL